MLGVSACSSSVELPAPSLAGDDLARCEAFVSALPDELAGLERRPVSPEDALGAAYGDLP